MEQDTQKPKNMTQLSNQVSPKTRLGFESDQKVPENLKVRPLSSFELAQCQLIRYLKDLPKSYKCAYQEGKEGRNLTRIWSCSELICKMDPSMMRMVVPSVHCSCTCDYPPCP
eukprot:TRINITY_DN25635_c0_g1_i1.p1 TRINITY_DN25635_c0_g1~~TRINITY_DN25635_c0_g1_i1.p1  ORF type:complete len:113 (+),score=8.00 TRINITY_DN25635_c0_g1_i1:528-866(+)